MLNARKGIWLDDTPPKCRMSNLCLRFWLTSSALEFNSLRVESILRNYPTRTSIQPMVYQFYTITTQQTISVWGKQLDLLSSCSQYCGHYIQNEYAHSSWLFVLWCISKTTGIIQIFQAYLTGTKTTYYFPGVIKGTLKIWVTYWGNPGYNQHKLWAFHMGFTVFCSEIIYHTKLFEIPWAYALEYTNTMWYSVNIHVNTWKV